MALVKVRAWPAMAAAAAALLAGGGAPARADVTAGGDRMAAQGYTTECSTPQYGWWKI